MKGKLDSAAVLPYQFVVQGAPEKSVANSLKKTGINMRKVAKYLTDLAPGPRTPDGGVYKPLAS